MKKVFQYALPLLTLFILGSWNYFVDPDKAVLLVADKNEKITLLESGKVDAAVFAKGIKAFTVLQKAEKYQVMEATFVYSPLKGDAKFWIARYDSDNRLINSMPTDILQDLSSVQSGTKIIIDNILYEDEAGIKKYLSPIVITIK